MSGFQCPYCSMIMPITDTTKKIRYPGFNSSDDLYYNHIGEEGYNDECVGLVFYKCPNCEQTTISARGLGKKVSDINMQLRPNSLAKKFPNYIPESIRSDYEEAYAILFLSPKASATLSRRCLQGMIRDFWGICESTLYKEITALKDKIPNDLWQSIDALRQLGNIGAHMEKDTNIIIDIEPNEAETLLRLIELLIKEWYINREERNKLFSDIISTNQSKKSNKKDAD